MQVSPTMLRDEIPPSAEGTAADTRTYKRRRSCRLTYRSQVRSLTRSVVHGTGTYLYDFRENLRGVPIRK